MNEPLIWIAGNRNPSITENIIDTAGNPVDLTAAAVRFKAREFNTATLIVDQVATVVAPATGGNVRYDWSAADIALNGILNDAGRFLVWWEVTAGGKTQDVMEAVIEVRAHAPMVAYVELEEFKQTLSLTGQTYADLDIQLALVAASRAVDAVCDRRFYADTDVNQVRYYTPNGSARLAIDDLDTLTTVQVDTGGDSVFEETWTVNTDFVLAPLNADADSRPFTVIELHPRSSRYFPKYPRSVKVTGRFGWPAVPAEVKEATSMIAARALKRVREAPFGVVALGVDGEAIRISQYDPDVSMILTSVRKATVY